MQKVPRSNQCNKNKIITRIPFVHFPRITKAKPIHKHAPGLQGSQRRKIGFCVGCLYADMGRSSSVNRFMTWKSCEQVPPAEFLNPLQKQRKQEYTEKQMR